MSNPLLQPQWAVDQTTSSVVRITMGALAACASDNVQPIAYLACDKLGATLAISNDTARKIQAVVVPPTTPASVAFLKAKIGFFSNNSAALFGKSQSGVSFLALAAALSTTLPLFDAARAIEVMLEGLLSDPVELPSTRNLKILLESLEQRCHRAGFADDVLGWQVLLQQIVMPIIKFRDHDERHHRQRVLLSSCPSPEMVDRLVDTLRQVGRLGSSTVTGVTIRLCTAVPWVIAFTKWSLGAPPRICFDGQASDEILPSPSSIVTLLIPRFKADIKGHGGMSVAIHHSIGSPCELLAPSDTHIWTGMVSITVYGESLLQNFGFRPDFENRMLHESLSCAIPQCLELLNLSLFVPENLHKERLDDTKNIDASLMSRRFSPLPNAGQIAATYQRLFDLPSLPKFRTPTSSTRVRDCPLVKDYLERLKGQCICADCSAVQSSHGIIACDRVEFYQRLSRIIATILSLSLFATIFDNPSSLLLSVPLHGLGVDDDVEEAIYGVLVDGETQIVGAQDLFKHARRIIGHKDPESDDKPPVMTSGRGQVLFPALLERGNIAREGYMALSCIPGVLKYENQIYKEAGRDTELIIERPRPSDDAPPVAAPINLFPDVEAHWEVTKQDDEHLGCRLRVRSKANARFYGHLHPIRCLFGLMNGLLLETCPHSSRARLDKPDEFASYCGPLEDTPATPETRSHIAVVAVHGADDLRMVSVNIAHYSENNTFYVLRGDACLACCLRLCRLADVNRLIL